MNNIAIISFFASLAGIIGMIIWKKMPTHTKIDQTIDSVYRRVSRFISYFNRHSAIALIQWVVYHVLSLIRSVYIAIRAKAHAHPPSKKVLDMVRGKVVIDRNSGASFYLKKIGEGEVVK